MKVPTFKPGDVVQMIPDSGWRGVIVAKSEHRNKGYKVRTTKAHSSMCSAEFWVRPISIEPAGD